MAHFIVSARKYRPETFKSVVGQDSITSTLKNAIRNGQLGHAYLFCGPRGIGKTTCARIFAKTINCQDLSPETEPCNQCESCISFNESRSYNIHELDAASNNSVEDIRTLIEQVRIPPQIGRYSVYIIDEVHMLSQQAFNAFLKTLEEPPAHAVFILATTEKHKIIPTILSRCQIFDFNRIRVEDTVNYLKYIAEKEDISYETEALHIIAQKSDGAMRDALSIFDQVVSFSGSDIKYQDVINNLNILDLEYFFKLTGSFLQGDYSTALLILDEILNDGFDAHNFVIGLAGHFRNLLVSTNKDTLQLLETSENIRQKYLDQSAACTSGYLFSALSICNEVDLNFKTSRNQRLLVELALIRLSSLAAEKKKPEPELTNEKPQDVQTAGSSTANTEKVKIKRDDSSSGEHAPSKEVEGSSREHAPPKKEEGTRNNVVTNPSISIRSAFSAPRDIETESLEDTVEKEEITDEEIVNEANEFTQDELSEVWIRFSEKIKSDRPRIAVMLKSHQPLLNEGYEIAMVLDNTAQLEEFNKNIRNELTGFLIKELKNSYLQITSNVAAGENSKRMMYTDEERFQYLSRKNPALNRLKQQFNLDFE